MRVTENILVCWGSHMVNLIAAAFAFLILHRVVSGTSLRDTLTRRFGESLYLRVFAVVSLGALLWLSFAFAEIRSRPENVDFWIVSPIPIRLQLGIQLVAVLFILLGLVAANPGTVNQQDVVNRSDIAQGILRVTRHPFLWGMAIFAGGHLLARSDVASWIMFGTLLVVALSGTVSIDAKRRRQLGERWLTFSNQTSNIPFVAILRGRQSLGLIEIGWGRPLVAVSVWSALLFAHPFLFGTAAFR